VKQLSQKGKKWIAVIVLLALAVGVTSVATLGVNHTNGAARVVERFVASFNDKDFDAFCNCFMPADQQTLKKAVDAMGGSDAFFEQNYATMFSGENGFTEFGENITLSVGNMKTENQKLIDGHYNGIDMASMNVSSVATVNCVITTKGSLKEVSENIIGICVKIDGKWYLYTLTASKSADATATDISSK
jgi:hypothetical protein